MKLWLDDVRVAPTGYVHAKSVNQAIALIEEYEKKGEQVQLVDLDHDLGDYAVDGGDGIKFLDYLVENGKFYPVKLHTMNPVGRDNMQRVIDRYWK